MGQNYRDSEQGGCIETAKPGSIAGTTYGPPSPTRN